MEFSPWDGFSEFDSAPQFAYHYQCNQHCFKGLPELENLNFDDFDLPPLDEKFVVEEKPLLNMVMPQPPPPPHGFGEQSSVGVGPGFGICVKEEVMEENNGKMQLLHNNSRSNSCSSKKRSLHDLKFEEIRKYFGVPITEAAKEMNVGLTVLKRRCRELNIMRWPQRKLKSLDLLINNAKEMGMSNKVALLEQHRKMLEKVPGMELTEETKKLMQACFKANYKKRRYLAPQSRSSETF